MTDADRFEATWTTTRHETDDATAGRHDTQAERLERDQKDEHHSVRERVAGTEWRQRIAAKSSLNQPYRIGVGIAGAVVSIGGLALIPLPGPGWLIVIGGLFILATEFTWAERLLEFTKRHVTSWTDWVGRQPLWLKGIIAVATAAFVYGLIVVTLHLLGVPSWIPDWVPLWR